MRIEITAKGIYGTTGEVPVGTILEVGEAPKGLEGRYRVLSEGGEGKTAIVNPKGQEPPAYEARHRGGGSYSIMLGDQEVVGKLTKADAEAFNGLSADDKRAFVDASKQG